MRYSFRRIFHQLWYYRGRYLVIWAELMAGSAVLSLCVNMFLTSRAMMQEFERSMQEDRTIIQYNWLGDSYSDPYVPIDYQQYQTILQEYGDRLELSYTAWIYASAFMGEEYGEVAEWTVVYMDDLSFEEMFGTERRPKTAYTGESARQTLERLQENQAAGVQTVISLYGGEEFHVEDGAVSVKGGTCAIAPLPETEVQEIVSPWLDTDTDEAGRIWLADCVILPVEFLEKPDLTVEHTVCQCTLTAHGRGKAENLDVLNQLTERLGELNPEFTFRIDDRYLMLESQRESMDWAARYWLRISAVVLFLVGGSLTGILLVLMYERRRVKAVAYVSGSTRLRLEAETLGEMAFLFAAAVIPGGVLGWLLNVSGKTGISNLRYFASGNLVLAGVSVLILACVYLIAGAWERRISFVQILKGE